MSHTHVMVSQLNIKQCTASRTYLKRLDYVAPPDMIYMYDMVMISGTVLTGGLDKVYGREMASGESGTLTSCDDESSLATSCKHSKCGLVISNQL